jgi:hypothetical protein
MMAVGSLWPAVRRQLPRLLLLAAAAAVLAAALVQRAGPQWRAHFSYLISLQEREAAAEFRFDGYYALQATDLFAATLAEWAMAPEVIAAAHQAADLPLPGADARSLIRTVSARKAAPQLVAVEIRGGSEREAAALASGLQEVLTAQVAAYHTAGVPAARFTAVPSAVWVGGTPPATRVVGAATFLLVLFVLVNGVVLAETLRETRVTS